MHLPTTTCGLVIFSTVSQATSRTVRNNDTDRRTDAQTTLRRYIYGRLFARASDKYQQGPPDLAVEGRQGTLASVRHRRQPYDRSRSHERGRRGQFKHIG